MGLQKYHAAQPSLGRPPSTTTGSGMSPYDQYVTSLVSRPVAPSGSGRTFKMKCLWKVFGETGHDLKGDGGILPSTHPHSVFISSHTLAMRSCPATA